MTPRTHPLFIRHHDAKHGTEAIHNTWLWANLNQLVTRQPAWPEREPPPITELPVQLLNQRHNKAVHSNSTMHTIRIQHDHCFNRNWDFEKSWPLPQYMH